MRHVITSLLTAFAISLGLVVAVFPAQSVLADQWYYPDIIGTNNTLTYYAQSNVETRLYTGIQNAMTGWNGIHVNRWGPSGNGPYRFDTTNSNDVGQIVEYYSNYPDGSIYAGYTHFSAAGGQISSIRTDLNDVNFSFNTGTTSSGTSISIQDLMVHEFGFAVSLYEGCFGANSSFGTPADTYQNSVMCDKNLVNNNYAPLSNDAAAVRYIYQ